MASSVVPPAGGFLSHLTASLSLSLALILSVTKSTAQLVCHQLQSASLA